MQSPNTTINLYTWHKSKESVFCRSSRFKLNLQSHRTKDFWKQSGDLISWYGLGQDCWSLVIQFAYESNSMEVFLDQMWKFRKLHRFFPQKKLTSKILPHDGGFGWPQFKKKPWDCDPTLILSFVTLWSFFLPPNFHRCDLPPCTSALGKDPPAMPRSLSRYLHSRGTLKQKKTVHCQWIAIARKRWRCWTTTISTEVFSAVQLCDFSNAAKDQYSTCFFIFWIIACCFSKGGASNKLHILVELCLRRSYLSLRNPRSSNTLSSARHA